MSVTKSHFDSVSTPEDYKLGSSDYPRTLPPDEGMLDVAGRKRAVVGEAVSRDLSPEETLLLKERLGKLLEEYVEALEADDSEWIAGILVKIAAVTEGKIKDEEDILDYLGVADFKEAERERIMKLQKEFDERMAARREAHKKAGRASGKKYGERKGQDTFRSAA